MFHKIGIWFIKTFLAKKFIADVMWEAVFGAEDEDVIIDLSGLKYGVVSVTCHFKEYGLNIGPRITKKRKCYFWRGSLLWE